MNFELIDLVFEIYVELIDVGLLFRLRSSLEYMREYCKCKLMFDHTKLGYMCRFLEEIETCNKVLV